MECVVYNFTKSNDFLAALLMEKKSKNAGFSLRAWCKQLGFRNPSTLSAVLQGRRHLSPELAHRLAGSLCVTNEERRYFEVLAMMDKAKTPIERDVYIGILDSIRPLSHRITPLEVEHFRFIAEWHHVAILEMVSLKDFENDAKWIADQLGPEISVAAVQEAIARLIKLGWLELDAHKRLVKKVGRYFVGDSVPSDAVRNHHEQMIERAKLALHTQSFGERDFRGTTLAIKEEHLPNLLEAAKTFHDSVHKFNADRDADKVYRINTQVFRINQKSTRRTKGHDS